MTGELGLGTIERAEMEAVQALDGDGFTVEACYCQMGDHEWLEDALGRVGVGVLRGLDDPGDLRDSYPWERYSVMKAAVMAHAGGAGNRLWLARAGDELLAVVSFEPDLEVAGAREMVVTNLGSTGEARGAGRTLLSGLGDMARRLERPLRLRSAVGAEGFYTKVGLKEVAGGSWRWELADLPKPGPSTPGV